MFETSKVNLEVSRRTPTVKGVQSAVSLDARAGCAKEAAESSGKKTWLCDARGIESYTKLPTLTFHPGKSTGMEIQNSNPPF